MKLLLRGIHLLESAFQHASDPFSASGAPSDVEQQAEVKVELSKGEAQHDHLILLRVRNQAQSAYVFGVTYAVIMTADLEGESAPEKFEQQVMTTGATIAFPYCRELVSNLTARGRFGVLWLNPINFANLIMKGEAATSATTAAK